MNAARSRVSPAGALDDPMLEVGVLNYPVESRSFKTEDMTMKMIGFAQRLPYPGKRALRRDVAEKEALAVESNLQELVNRVRRDVKVAYFDLGFIDESLRLAERTGACWSSTCRSPKPATASGRAPRPTCSRRRRRCRRCSRS